MASLPTARLGFNYRNEWGKKITVLMAAIATPIPDRLSTTTSQTQSLFQSGAILSVPITASGKPHNLNHRIDFNMEYRIDSLNYLKINPNFSYNSSNDNTTDAFSNTRNQTLVTGNELALTNSTAPSGGISMLYNHKFRKIGRNFSINTSLNYSKNTQDLNDQYTTEQAGVATPLYQQINTNNSSNRYNIALSYTEPLGKGNFLEANYNHSYSNTDNNRANYNIDPLTGTQTYVDSLSTLYNYQFITNKFGLNLRGVKTKYNYTLGLAVQPSST
jgi:hypothetical protein